MLNGMLTITPCSQPRVSLHDPAISFSLEVAVHGFGGFICMYEVIHPVVLIMISIVVLCMF